MGTLVVNALGGLAMGVALATLQRHSLTHLFIVTGFLGGFTTFSAFSAESLGMLQRGQWWWAGIHGVAHVVGVLACTWMGYALARGALRV